MEDLILSEAQIKKIIQEISEESEKTRRALAKRRHDIYQDGGKKFLIEQIHREFGADAIKEMRLAPVNVLKKIVNRIGSVYKKPPVRKCELEADQKLVDYYVDFLSFNELMQKANRYYVLFSNTVLYAIPSHGGIKAMVVPPYLYSVVPNQFDPTKIEAYVFNRFTESGQVAQQDDLLSATGVEGFSRQTSEKSDGDLVASNERESVGISKQFMFWTGSQHFTTTDTGSKIIFDKEQGQEQWMNPIECLPVINLAKDRDAEPWAQQGEDMSDLALAIQIGWTDLLTIAKHQGFSILTVVSPEEPKQLTIGVNRAVWLKQQEGITPTISYVQGNSPLDQYKQILLDLLGILLTTNDMSSNSVSGIVSSKNFTSGFQALIESADTLEAVENDKPAMRKAEKDFWLVIAKWHNYMFDQQVLSDEAKAFGKFSDAFEVSIHYSDMKPIESEQERISLVKDLIDYGLITKKDALKKLNPDLTDDQIDQKLKDLESEADERVAKAKASIQNSGSEDQSNGKSEESSKEETSKESLLVEKEKDQMNGET